GGARLLEEALALVGAGGEVRRGQLDGDRAVERHIAGQEHDPHAAPAELALDRIAAGEQLLEGQEFGADRGGHVRRAPVVMMRTLAPGCDGKPGESTTLALPSTPPGTYCTATQDRRWSVNGTVTSRTRREWLRMMAAMGAGALVDGLLPRELARAATGRLAQQQ